MPGFWGRKMLSRLGERTMDTRLPNCGRYCSQNDFIEDPPRLVAENQLNLISEGHGRRGDYMTKRG